MARKWLVVTDEQGMGHEVIADAITIEPSGAITFWNHVIRGQSMELVIGFNHTAWISVEKSNAGIEDTTPESLKESGQRL